MNIELPEEQVLLSSEDIGRMIGVPSWLFWQLYHEGKIRLEPVRIGRSVLRWRRAEVLKRIDAGCPGKTAAVSD
jgi:hypothetical protein